MNCRHCQSSLEHCFIDLGFAPPSNAYIQAGKFTAPEQWYPLRVMVCQQCWLIQTEDHTGRELLFSEDYAYFSSFSESWLLHAKTYVNVVRKRFELNETSLVCEIAANDGYLLQYVQDAGIPCYGIEPTTSTANAARKKNIEIIGDFFDVNLARNLLGKGKQVDLLVANNVLAHVPDINNFVKAFSVLLKEQGVATFEFPHLLNLIEKLQFDTIYHEHYSYLSITAIKSIFEKNGLSIFDIEELPTHGGSLRVYTQKSQSGSKPVSAAVNQIIEKEKLAGLSSLDAYAGYQAKSEQVKNNLLKFLIEANEKGKKVAAYGAAAKGNTILNFAGIRPDLISFIVDKNPSKIGQLMPGSHIPIVDETQIEIMKPDYILILPWNLKKEISKQISYIREWGGQCFVAVPDIELINPISA